MSQEGSRTIVHVMPKVIVDLLEDENIPDWIKEDLYALTSRIMALGFITPQMYRELKIKASQIIYLILMSVTPRKWTLALISKLKQAQMYFEVQLSRSLYGHEREMIVTTRHVMETAEVPRKQGIIEKMRSFFG